MATPFTYLVFGDLHGRILPAFRLAAVWAREKATRVDGLLQVGDLGWFPDPSRLDKATKRHAERDPLELGAMLVAEPSKEADQVFADEDAPPTMWFTAGNHEDFEDLQRWQGGAGGKADSFAVDHYLRVRAVSDGRVECTPGDLHVAALWGIDADARPKIPPRARIIERSATQLTAHEFDVLLSHDCPRDAVIPNAGSSAISALISLAQPAFAFFGHYGRDWGQIEGEFGRTQVYHLAGLELRGDGGTAEEGAVGALQWDGSEGQFEYLDAAWLRTFSRHGWLHR